MTRRAFITLLGGAVAAWPIAARAQRSERTARIGFLYPGPLAVAPPRIEIVLSGLRSAGRQGEQVELVPRVADSDPARLPRLAAELIEEKVAGLPLNQYPSCWNSWASWCRTSRAPCCW